MAETINTLAITISLMGIAFTLHFSATKYYFFGQDPTGFSMGTLGLIFTLLAVLLSAYNVISGKKE